MKTTIKIQEPMNNPNKKTEIQTLLFGLAAIAVIILFTYAFSKNFAEKEIAKMEELKIHNEGVGKIANDKIDSALLQGSTISAKVGNLEGQVFEQGKSIYRIEQSQDKNFNELKKFKNEKNNIPPASADEQYEYLSKYKYKPY
ncbi:hypothetical protein ACFQO9_04570 [Chryseobacterium zhengzhouense]|uniref:Uncharacterized protein n=1 Tax=Chryseobacterium zhengzhouense TaxID=1636086 RepID=A0ABW2LU10_9FLAO